MSIESRLTALQLKVEEILTVAKNGNGRRLWSKDEDPWSSPSYPGGAPTPNRTQPSSNKLFSLQDPPPPLLSPHAEIRTLELWRCVVAECLGTLFFVFFVCGACIPWTGHFPPFFTIAFATALVYGALSYRVFPGSHLNPAFTLALCAIKRVSPLRFLLFLVAQSGGAIAGAAILFGLTVPGYQGVLGGNTVASHVNPWQACGLEFILSFVMTLTFLSDPSNCFATAAILLAANLVALPCTGAGLNPVRSLGPAFVMNKWPSHWVFWFGPLVGGMTAAYLHAFILHRSKKGKKIRENPSDGDSMDIPATELPNANTVPESIICERFEPLYGGTRSLYMKPSPVLPRQNLHRSQSVYASGRRFDFPAKFAESSAPSSAATRKGGNGGNNSTSAQHPTSSSCARHFETDSNYEPIYDRKPPTGANQPLLMSGPPSYDSTYFKAYDTSSKPSHSSHHGHNHANHSHQNSISGQSHSSHHHREKNEIHQQRERDRDRERENQANRILAQYETAKGLVDVDPKAALKNQNKYYEEQSCAGNSKRSSQLDNIERKLIDPLLSSCSHSESESAPLPAPVPRHRSASSHHSSHRCPPPPPRSNDTHISGGGPPPGFAPVSNANDLGRNANNGNYMHTSELKQGRHEARKPYDYVDPKKLLDTMHTNGNGSENVYSPRLLLGDKDSTYSRILEPLLNSKSAASSPLGPVVTNGNPGGSHGGACPMSPNQFTYSYH